MRNARASTQVLTDRLQNYAQLMRLDRPIGTFLLLWPTLWAIWIAAAGRPSIKVLIVFVLGVFIMRSAGCVINDYADREFDPHVKRTRNRPLAAGRVQPREAIILFAVLCGVAFMLVLTMNRLTILLSLVGVLLAATYPFMKRFHHLPQAHLGAAFSWAVPMAFAAETNSLPPVCWLLFAINLLWTVVYDTVYAMVDREDDLRIGLRSTAILFGDLDRLVVAVMQLLVLVGLYLLGLQADLGWIYRFALVWVAGLMLYQQLLIRQRDEQKCFKAFLNNNWLGFVVFLGIVADYWARPV
jgi:4-hydroxybenzoate polyprenyltransferase